MVDNIVGKENKICDPRLTSLGEFIVSVITNRDDSVRNWGDRCHERETKI